MSHDEICNQVIAKIRSAAPSQSVNIIPFLQELHRQYSLHPCFPLVAHEIVSILTEKCQISDFLEFCFGTGNPEKFIDILFLDIKKYTFDRDYGSASHLMEYLLAYGMKPWPEDSSQEEFRSFRDLFEYSYYMVAYEPAREVVIKPFIQTDILYYQGLILSGLHRNEAALTLLKEADRQSPVHAGILNAIVSILLKIIRHSEDGIHPEIPGESIQPLISRSFRCAWRKDELAQVYRNQGSLLSISGDIEGAITCFLMADTWGDSAEFKEDLSLLDNHYGRGKDTRYYTIQGKKILEERNVPAGPDPEVVSLLIRMADDYLEEHDLFKAREYLIYAHELIMSDELDERIWRIERFIEDTVEF